MSGARDEQRPEAAAEATAGWFARLKDEAATGEDWLEFEQWLGASRAHAMAYERIEQAWVDLDEAPASARVEPPISLAARRASLSRRVWLAAGAALAASVAIGVIGVVSVDEAPTQTYVTAPGETRDVVLADGTHLRLNASSRLTVRMERHARRVQMADAEAAFDVTHDLQRPFLITAGDREVRVVGTEFNLRHRAADLALTVRRGVVEVRPTDDPRAPPARVAAGYGLTHRNGAGGDDLSIVEPNAAFGWTRGQLVYVDAPLSDVALDLSRSLGAPIRVANAATGRLRFSGTLVIDDKAAVLRRLEAFAPLRAETRADGVVLHRR